MKKAQSSIEFMVLLGFSIIVVTAIMFLVGIEAERRATIQNEMIVQELFTVIDTEVGLASVSPAIYTRTFFIPYLLDGRDYTIELEDSRDIVVNFNNDLYVFFLNQTISGNLSKGDNTITKTCTGPFTCQISIS
jgi:hypothetical protein